MRAETELPNIAAMQAQAELARLAARPSIRRRVPYIQRGAFARRLTVAERFNLWATRGALALLATTAARMLRAAR